MSDCRQGFSLLELAIALSVAAVLAGAVVPVFIRSVQLEGARKAAQEIMQLQEAALAYRRDLGMWPATLKDLSAGGLIAAGWQGRNPFGREYILLPEGTGLSVRTEVPAGVPSLLASLLPMSRVEGESVYSSVTASVGGGTGVPSGAMMPWPSPDIPQGWQVCDGRALSRDDYAALFSAIGTRYGNGDGNTTFNVPDLRGRAVVGMDNMGGSAANVIRGSWARQVGGTFGEETHALTIDEMPAHTHGYWESPVGGRYDGHSSPVVTGQRWSATQPAGGSAPHNVVQPSMALNWVIKE